jgi:hypothetical protein
MKLSSFQPSLSAGLVLCMLCSLTDCGKSSEGATANPQALKRESIVDGLAARVKLVSFPFAPNISPSHGRSIRGEHTLQSWIAGHQFFQSVHNIVARHRAKHGLDSCFGVERVGADDF